MRLLLAVGLAAALILPAAAEEVPRHPKHDELMAFASGVDQARMKSTVEKLVSFGTRHTLSSQTDPKRGIGAAINWADREMKKLGLETIRNCDTVSGRRIPEPTRVCNVLAIQRGTERPDHVVIITGHIDSRVTDPMDFTSDAPGANDDGSGTAAVIEAARALAKHKFPGTIIYAVLSGEEQGLYGGKILADYATAQGWNVIANLNNDIIGNSCGSDGVCDADHVRVFSEGLRWQGGDLIRGDVRRLGGENDSPSRNISRYLATLAEGLPGIGIQVRQIRRNDRFGRGGDHTELLNAGFPAVRLSVAVEDYDHQHQDLRVEKGVTYGDTVDEMDFAYLAKVTKLNVAALAAVASAPPPPEPSVEGAVSTDTTVKWDFVQSHRNYTIYWRRTDDSRWEYRYPTESGKFEVWQRETGLVGSPGGLNVTIPQTRVDDWIFGVSSVSADGYESPVASAVPGGAFKPYVPPKEEEQ